MRTFARYALSISATAASLAGCAAASQSSLDAPRTTQASTAVGPDARNLLYVAIGSLSVQVFTYPRGKSIGSLGVGGYLCSDRFGKVFVTGAEGISYVWVFPHGSGRPIATLYNPQSPGGCSVDESSENVAVADSDSSAMVIFPYNRKRGWSLAHQYNDPNMRASLDCAYDPEGNLFLDGYSTSGSFILVELPKGGSTFTAITLDRIIHSPGSLQWDRNDLVVEDAGVSRSSAAVIYRFAIDGHYGHKVSASTLTDSEGNAQFLIHGSTVIGPLSYNSAEGIGFWRFPSGGAPVRTITTYGYPVGEAFSLK